LIKIFQVEKMATPGGNLLGEAPAVGVTLLGSSYTADWTNFPVAMRYALQRDVLSISVNALQGQWVGLHTYLRDDAFQANKPKLLIWEMPERDMRAPPDMKYRDAQYVMDNTEWLLQTSALIQTTCAASALKVQIDTKGMRSAQNANGKVAASNTGADEFIELNFEKPLDRLDYLAASLTTAGSVAITLEASGAGVKARRYTVKVAGDDAAHNLRSALAVQGGGKGFTKVRLYPGKANSVALSDVQVCRQPDDLLTP
jgi:alginate O-acetyltransferase complex protein AlgJ